MTAGSRILFVAEGVTLAHVVRPLVLAKHIQQDYEVHFAVADSYRPTVRAEFSGGVWLIHSQPAKGFLAAVEGCRVLYRYSTLADYVQEELELFEALQPDLVVGDFRWSLAVSTALRKIPYLNLMNAHWSPYALRRHLPLPTRFSRIPGIDAAMPRLEPLLLGLHLSPLNRLRRRFGLPACGSFFEAVSQADHVAYLDTPLASPTRALPANHGYIGPLLWSPPIPHPEWWHTLPADRKLAYVTMGSSGHPAHLKMILSALRQVNAASMVATAGRGQAAAAPEHAYFADFLPGDACAERADLVICNGGSATAYQALSKGKPVIGIAHNNVDQLLTMTNLSQAGGGVLIRSSELDTPRLAQAITEVLNNPRYLEAARRMQSEFAAYKAPSRFAALVDGILLRSKSVI